MSNPWQWATQAVWESIHTQSINAAQGRKALPGWGLSLSMLGGCIGADPRTVKRRIGA